MDCQFVPVAPSRLSREYKGVRVLPANLPPFSVPPGLTGAGARLPSPN